MTAAGADPADAQIVAAALVWADLRARHPQGLSRLPMLVERLARGLIVSPAAMSWTESAPAVHQLDASDGFGQVAGRRAMERAISLARSHGVGVVGVRRSNLYGAAGYFCAQAAAAGCLGFACTNAVAKVAAFGGAEPVLGTNPLAFGSPTLSGAPLLVDLSTGALAGSEAREREERGDPLPEGTALDATGEPTTDPGAVAAGCLLPMAGPKGFGLGLMVEVLSGVWSGAAVGREVGSMYGSWERSANTGHFFLALHLGDAPGHETFLARLQRLLSDVRNSRRLRGVAEIRIPGELRGRLAESYQREGIPLPGSTLAALEGLARRFGLELPGPGA